MINRNILLCGVGGQGTVLASRVIAQAAMEKGVFARTAETIGMAQRGGCVVSHVRIGDGINSSLVPLGKADVIIGFEPGEAVRCLPYLKENGVVVTSPKAVQPVTAALAGSSLDGGMMVEYLKKQVERVIVVDVDAVCDAVGSPKVLNVALLGAAAASGELDMTLEDVENVLESRLPGKLLDMNIKALKLGAEYAAADR